MKITCNNCQKKFDYEKSMGICPACGRYFRNPQAAAQSGETTSGETTSGETTSSETTPKESTNKKQKQTTLTKKNAIILVVSIILLLCMVGDFLITKYVILPWQIEAAYEHQKQGEPQEIEGTLDEPFDIEGVDYEIGAITNFELEGIEAPGGWEYVQIPFKVYTDDLDYDKRNALSVYLYIDGYYASPISIYNFPEYDQENSVGRLNLNSEPIYDTFSDTLKGKFVFLIPENADVLEFYIYQTEEDSEDKIIVENLEYIYRFAVGRVNK